MVSFAHHTFFEHANDSRCPLRHECDCEFAVVKAHTGFRFRTRIVDDADEVRERGNFCGVFDAARVATTNHIVGNVMFAASDALRDPPDIDRWINRCYEVQLDDVPALVSISDRAEHALTSECRLNCEGATLVEVFLNFAEHDAAGGYFGKIVVGSYAIWIDRERIALTVIT
jgi:hypothetical protein